MGLGRIRVVVVGSINQDIVAEAARHPRPGETVIGTTLRFHPGGKGANQAVAAARAGAPTALVGCVGDDAAGQELLAVLQGAGVDCGAVGAVHGVPTGRGVITVAAGENAIVVVSGANAHVSPEQIEAVEFAAGDICVAQLETPVETTAVAFSRARAAGAMTIFNPAPADDVPGELIALSDLLVVNAHEFASIFGPADSAHVRFAGNLITTLGAGGADIREGATTLHVPGHAVEVVDSTGAGDCFVGYLAAGLAGGHTLEEAARWANRAAAISVTRHGAISSIPVAAEVSSRVSARDLASE